MKQIDFGCSTDPAQSQPYQNPKASLSPVYFFYLILLDEYLL